MTCDARSTGAEAVGLATALKLQERRPDWSVIVVDKADRVAARQSGHNSGVIHSGVYYPPGGTRARPCVKGYHQLLRFCEQEHIPYQLTGKFIVATKEAELPALMNIHKPRIANALIDLRCIT